MENNTPEVPNSPKELFELQRSCSQDKENSSGFANFLEEIIIPEEDPSVYQTVKAIEMMLTKLIHYHFDVLEEDDSLNKFQRKIWREDYNHLEKALKHVRLMHPD